MGDTHGGPIMPHRLYGEEGLSRRYPLLEAVAEAEEDEQLEDALLATGIEIAEQIVNDTVAFGRRRVQKTEEDMPLRENADASPLG